MRFVLLQSGLDVARCLQKTLHWHLPKRKAHASDIYFYHYLAKKIIDTKTRQLPNELG